MPRKSSSRRSLGRPKKSSIGTGQANNTGSNRLRIIAGQWRGRKLPFPAIEGLRPTPDRIRETLFNWISAEVPGCRCLDLFAGSGALGLEALSRGAAQATLVDVSAAAVSQLRDNLNLLGCQNAQIVQASATSWLQGGASSDYDLVFLDPPFRQGHLSTCCEALEQGGWLAKDALIYVELESECPLQSLPLPDSWELLRHKMAGQVQCCLFRRSGNENR